MKTVKVTLGILVAMLTISIAVNAQNKTVAFHNSGMATGEATANIVEPIQVEKTADLAFGNIAAGTAEGIVTISTDGSRNANGGVTLISAGNNSQAASFYIIGYPDATFAIDLPASIVISYNSEEMVVDNFESDLGSVSQLSGIGEAYLNVGASLNVNSNQAPGLYIGTFDVIVAYN